MDVVLAFFVVGAVLLVTCVLIDGPVARTHYNGVRVIQLSVGFAGAVAVMVGSVELLMRMF